jgi:hypothetical protein
MSVEESRQQGAARALHLGNEQHRLIDAHGPLPLQSAVLGWRRCPPELVQFLTGLVKFFPVTAP